jgi:hypothetical protein
MSLRQRSSSLITCSSILSPPRSGRSKSTWGPQRSPISTLKAKYRLYGFLLSGWTQYRHCDPSYVELRKEPHSEIIFPAFPIRNFRRMQNFSCGDLCHSISQWTMRSGWKCVPLVIKVRQLFWMIFFDMSAETIVLLRDLVL